MKNRGREFEANTQNVGHSKRIAILDWARWDCGCSYCSFNPNKWKSSRIKKHGRIRRVKPPWRKWMLV